MGIEDDELCYEVINIKTTDIEQKSGCLIVLYYDWSTQKESRLSHNHQLGQ